MWVLWIIIIIAILYLPLGVLTTTIQYRRGKIEQSEIRPIIVGWWMYLAVEAISAAFPTIERFGNWLVSIVVKLADRPKPVDSPSFTDILGDHKS